MPSQFKMVCRWSGFDENLLPFVNHRLFMFPWLQESQGNPEPVFVLIFKFFFSKGKKNSMQYVIIFFILQLFAQPNLQEYVAAEKDF